MTCLEQPPADLEWVTNDGIFLKEMRLAKAGTLVPQHAHTYEHTSIILRGMVRVWKDGDLLGDFSPPRALRIPARAKHTFMSLVADTSVLCVHNLNGLTHVSVLEEHQLEDS